MQETQETWVQSLGWEDPLEEEMATYSSILAWKNLTDNGYWQATAHEVTKESDKTLQLNKNNNSLVNDSLNIWEYLSKAKT